MSDSGCTSAAGPAWLHRHRQSEAMARDAHSHLNAGAAEEARALFASAAAMEESALAAVDECKLRTRGILAVSAVALWYKAGDCDNAGRLAQRELTQGDLLAEARRALQDLLASSRGENTMDVQSGEVWK